MKIALINPGRKNGLIPYKEKFLRNLISTPQMTLPYIAALTPPDIEIEIIDESYSGDEIDYDMDVDIVGITVLTHFAVRAYEIADEFRKRGVNVILGGVHPTAVPNEAKLHADAVVLGEAEGVWEQLIEDYKKGKLKGFYRRDNFHSLKDLPIPRWDLQGGYKFLEAAIVQVSRGCPFRCEFCSSCIIYGNKYRVRPIDDVIKEIDTLDAKYLFFAEDNIVGNSEYAKRLFKRLIPYKKQWHTFASITAVEDEEILKLLVKSGCIALDFGFESISEESLKQIGKIQNVGKDYKEVIKRLHDYGVIAYGSFIFGFDNEDESIFEKTVEFCMDIKLDVAIFFILTPFPGTPLYHRLNAEGRLLREDWWMEVDDDWWIGNYYVNQVLFQPKLMTMEELWDGYIWTAKECYTIKSIYKRLQDLDKVGWSCRAAALGLNLALKGIYSGEKYAATF